MPNWARLLFDLLRPSLFYSIGFSTLFAIVTFLLLKILKVENPKLRSFLYMLPLLTPLVVFVLFPPRVMFTLLYFSADTNEFVATQATSLAGLLCLAGLITSIVFFVLLYTLGHKLAFWLQGVVEIDPAENSALITMTRRLANRAGAAMPRIGLTEDLRPNAFTTGSGKHATIVVTLGLLNTLTETELEAVLAHELAHIKNRDILFNMLTLCLQVVSFFNPVVYFLAPAIRREREVLADRTGVTFLNHPSSLGLALTKIWEASQGGSRARLKGWISGVFILSELRFTRQALSKHPILERRLNHLVMARFWNKPQKSDILRMVLAGFLIIALMLWIFVPLVQLWMRYLWSTQAENAIGLQTATEDVSTIAFVVDPNYFRISNYFRIYDNLGIYNHVRIIYLPFYGATDPLLSPPWGTVDFSTVYTTDYPPVSRFTTILPWIMTFLVIAMVVVLLLRVCFNDLGNARTAKKCIFLDLE